MGEWRNRRKFLSFFLLSGPVRAFLKPRTGQVELPIKLTGKRGISGKLRSPAAGNLMLFFNRVHATLYVTLSVPQSVLGSVRNHSFSGIQGRKERRFESLPLPKCPTAPAHQHATVAVVYPALLFIGTFFKSCFHSRVHPMLQVSLLVDWSVLHTSL